MQLYQRVKQIASAFTIKQTSLGEKLGFLAPRTFQGYLNELRQDNLWPLLPRILELFPEVQRDWLYFGEGEMLKQKAGYSEQIFAPMLHHENAHDSMSTLKNTCSRCIELEAKLEKVELQRDDLLKENREISIENRKINSENRRLSKENKALSIELTEKTEQLKKLSYRPMAQAETA